MKKTKVKWLDSRLSLAPYLALCLSKEEYAAALSDLKATDNLNNWCNDDGASTTTLSGPGGVACIVCINVKDATPIDIAALLVHEAVHVWQNHCEDIGEKNPGREQEAYAIQAISKELMYEYARRLNGKSEEEDHH